MAYDFSKIKVLIVENNPAMFDLTKSVLGAFGIYSIISAYNVNDGFKKFQQERPDLVIIDWLDEKQGGVKLTEMIRKSDGSRNPFVPIIMMTGYSQKRRVIMARDSGITEFLVKPFTAQALYDKIEAVIEKPRQFVKADSFFGPDRRRKKDSYSGIDRRANHVKKTMKSPSAKAREIQSRSKDRDKT